MPKSELPSRQAVHELAMQALGLIEDRKPTSYGSAFEPYGGLESTYREYGVEERVVRIGTIQDWQGDEAELPDFHVVLTDIPQLELDNGLTARETRYVFGIEGFWGPRYVARNLEEGILKFDAEGKLEAAVATSGIYSQQQVRQKQSMSRKERRLFARKAGLNFSIDQYNRLAYFIDGCTPDTRIAVDSEHPRRYMGNRKSTDTEAEH